MKNNRRLQTLSVSCFSKFGKIFIAAAALAFLTAFAQAETISLSGGQTDSNAHSLADEGDTPAVTSSSGENKATGSLTLTGDSTFKIDSGSTLTLTQQLASNDYGSTRAITLYKTGAGTLTVQCKSHRNTCCGIYFGKLLSHSVKTFAFLYTRASENSLHAGFGKYIFLLWQMVI